MATPEHIRAQTYRKRRAEKLARVTRMETALRDIASGLETSKTDKGQRLRAIALAAVQPEEGRSS